jgi:catechol 2,3-dioxygenase-like lactoylglutathione lyase family enzyme
MIAGQQKLSHWVIADWRCSVANGKLRHIAISVPDKEKAAKFYENTFGFERVSQSRVAIRLSDGVMNITLLQFETQDDAGDERGKDFVGLHHFGIWVDDIDAMIEGIEAYGGKFHQGPTGHAPANAEYKFRDPNGIVFDISAHGWDGAKR